MFNHKKTAKNKPSAKPKRSEFHVQKALCSYAKLKYPRALWRSDMSGIKLDRKTAAIYWRDLAKYRGLPDWVCYEHFADKFIGLQIELKVEGYELWDVLDRNAGTEKEQAHVQEQLDMIEILRSRGWCAGFAVGSLMACNLLDAYMSGDLKKVNKYIYPKINPLL